MTCVKLALLSFGVVRKGRWFESSGEIKLNNITHWRYAEAKITQNTDIHVT
jgi:hypothetical protein